MQDMVIELKDGRVITLSEGTGDNLLREDIEEGYVDYLYYNIYSNILSYRDDEEFDGGMILLTEYAAELNNDQALMKLADMEGFSPKDVHRIIVS